jgi:hypothetical protein
MEYMFSVAFFPHFSKLFLVTFAPHCTLPLHPLDVAVMGPFKAKYAVAQGDWMMANRGGGGAFSMISQD